MDDPGPNNKALVTYAVGLTHAPEDEELKNGLRRASDELKKAPQGDEAGRSLSTSIRLMLNQRTRVCAPA